MARSYWYRDYLFKWFWWCRKKHPFVSFAPVMLLFLLPGLLMFSVVSGRGVWADVFRGCFTMLCWLTAIRLSQERDRFWMAYQDAIKIMQQARVDALDGRKRDE